MNTLLKTNLDCIKKEIDKGIKRFLVNGKSCSGKTKLTNDLVSFFKLEKKLNPLLINGSEFANFFSIDAYNNYKIIKIPIENSKITIDYRDENEIIIHPYPKTYAYTSIFKDHKYIDKSRKLSHNKNILIIDDCESINLLFLFILDKSLKIIFDEKELFGGIHMILIGNSKVKTFFDNIFSSALYNNEKNIHKMFTLLNINNVQTRFSKTNYSLEYNNLYYFLLKDKIQNRSGILTEKDKLFFKYRDVDIYRKDLKNYTYYCDNYNEIEKHNNDVIKNIKATKYLVQPLKLFQDEEVVEDKLEYFNTFYKNLLKPLVLFINLKIIFLSSISDLDIKKGQIGYVKKINLKKHIDSQKVLTCDHIKSIVIETEGIKKVIFSKIVKNRETGLSFKYFPINVGYCVHFKYLTYIEKGNLILTKDINIHIVESCINKIIDIGFKNTDLLNCSNLFESTYSDSIKNVIKF